MSRTSTPAQDTSRDPKRIIPVVVLVVILAVAAGIAVLVGGEDDGTGDAAQGLAYADVEVDGTTLPPLPDGGGADPAEGQPAPELEGSAPDGTAVTVDFGQPTLLAFLAHWCPHCQAELPRLVSLAEDGALEGLESVVVLTGTDPAAPNFPPAAWLDREGWNGTVLVDAEDRAAASAFGLTSYPYLVLVDEDGRVVARSAGELGTDQLRAFIDQAG